MGGWGRGMVREGVPERGSYRLGGPSPRGVWVLSGST